MEWKRMNKKQIKDKIMLRKFYIALACGMVACLGEVQAQDKVCVIKGEIHKDSLRYTPQRVQKIYLTKMDEYEHMVNVDSVKPVNGKFMFTRPLEKDEPELLYFLTGFDNGGVQVFVEQGTVEVAIPDAAFPVGGVAKGTPNNDLYNSYKEIRERSIREQNDTLKVWTQRRGDSMGDWMKSPEGLGEWMRVGAASLITYSAEQLRFLLAHNDSPLAPLMMEKEIYFTLSNAYVQRLLKSLSPKLKNHPYYRSFSNVVRAQELKVGGELPDITLPLLDGERKTLEDFKGKYVLLDFWASWCGPCRREIPYLIQLYNETQTERDRFVIVSFSLDNKEKDWQNAIRNHQMDKDGWMHASDLLGWSSPVARMLGVTAVPKTILIDPEGRAVSFSLRGEEMVNRVKQILAGAPAFAGGDGKEDDKK